MTRTLNINGTSIEATFEYEPGKRTNEYFDPESLIVLSFTAPGTFLDTPQRAADLLALIEDEIRKQVCPR